MTRKNLFIAWWKMDLGQRFEPTDAEWKIVMDAWLAGKRKWLKIRGHRINLLARACHEREHGVGK